MNALLASLRTIVCVKNGAIQEMKNYKIPQCLKEATQPSFEMVAQTLKSIGFEISIQKSEASHSSV